MAMGKSGVALLALARGSVMVRAANLRQNEIVVHHATSAFPPTWSHASRHLHDTDTSKYQYIGCFKDSNNDRVLDDKLTLKNDMSAEKCYDHCKGNGAKYMATQWAKECFCSDNEDLQYSRHGSSDDGCTMKCTGVEGETCGGHYAFDLYKVGDSTEDSPDSPSPSPDSPSPSPDSPSPPPDDKYEYIGCYKDSNNDRVLDDKLTLKNDMSAEKCYDHCIVKGAKYMATQWAEECFCSDNEDLEFDRHGSGAVCDMECTGVEGETCGGTHAFDLYKVGGSTEDSPDSPSPPPGDMAELLDLHNKARCVHGAEPLGWSDPVTSSAAEHAARLTETCSSNLYHSTQEQRNDFGENLFVCWGWGSGTCYSHEWAMQSLYDDEVEDEDEDEEVTDYGGHATQILWKSTKNVGCALAGCTNGETSYKYMFLVCQYDPAGNIIGQVENEVGLPNSGNSC